MNNTFACPMNSWSMLTQHLLGAKKVVVEWNEKYRNKSIEAFCGVFHQELLISVACTDLIVFRMKIFFYLIRLTIYQFFQSIYYCTKRIKGQGSNPVREEVSNMRLISILLLIKYNKKKFWNVEHWRRKNSRMRWRIHKFFLSCY